MTKLDLQALGTYWLIETFDGEMTKDLIHEIKRCVEQFEENYSRFKPTSLVSVLNDSKHLHDPPKELLNMLDYALAMYRDTDGLFNISVGGPLEQLGYGRPVDPASKVSCSLTQDITRTAYSVSLAPSVRLDFGGFGKGWLIDKLGRILSDNGHSEYLVNGGGDLLVQRSQPMDIAIEHPYDSTLGIGVVRISTGGLAASSTNKRHWQTHDGSTAHHLIKPSSGLPVDNAVASMHVYAPTALLADTLSTVLLLADNAQRATIRTKFSSSYMAIATDLQFFMTTDFPAVLHS